MLGVRHAGVSPHSKLYASLVGALETGDVLINRRLSLPNYLRPNACSGAMLHHVADGRRSGDEIGSVIQHKLNAIVVQQIAMFDGIDACLDGVLNCRCTMGMGAANLAGSVCLLDRRTHLLDGKLWSANFATWAEDAAACDELHIVGARLDLRSSRAAHRIRPVRLVTTRALRLYKWSDRSVQDAASGTSPAARQRAGQNQCCRASRNRGWYLHRTPRCAGHYALSAAEQWRRCRPPVGRVGQLNRRFADGHGSRSGRGEWISTSGPCGPRTRPARVGCLVRPRQSYLHQ